MSGEDEHKDEIKPGQEVKRKRSGQSKDEGEGGGRYFILTLNFRGIHSGRVLSAVTCPIPAPSDKTGPDQKNLQA